MGIPGARRSRALVRGARWVAAMIALIAAPALQGQAADSVALRHAHGQPPPTVSAVGVTRAPSLDGRLDDPAWAVAVSISELIQQDPHEGTPVSEPRSLKVNAVLRWRSEEHTSELQSRLHLVCRLLLEKKKK